MRYAVRRLILLVPTLLGMLVGVFFLLHLTPGDPVLMLVDVDIQTIPKEQLDLIRRDLGLDRPLPEQFVRYVLRVAQGDLGTSHRSKLPVAQFVASNFAPTFQLAIAGIIVALLIGIPSGVISAIKPNTLIDYITLTASMVGLSAPSFWLGILLIYVFAFRLNWFPMTGAGEANLVSFLWHITMPAFVIGVHAAALIARLTRSATLEALGQDYVRTAYSKGLRSSHVVIGHVLRNAAIPVIAAAGTTFAYLLTGSVVIELVFSRPGLGSLMVGAINGRDFPLVQGLVLVFGTVIVLANLLSDLLIGLVDPRVIYG